MFFLFPSQSEPEASIFVKKVDFVIKEECLNS